MMMITLKAHQMLEYIKIMTYNQKRRCFVSQIITHLVVFIEVITSGIDITLGLQTSSI